MVAATSCSLRSARIASGLTHFLMAGFGFFVVEKSDGAVSSVPIVREAGLRLARRADTWDGTYVERVGFVVLDCVSALTVSCCLRQPRIASGITPELCLVVRDFHLRGLGALLL